MSPAQPATSDLLNKAKAEKWWQDRQWHRLVQYEKSLLGNYSSPAESSIFFLAPDGKTNPEQELLQTIQALLENRIVTSKDGRIKEPAICLFPARKIWLEQKGKVKFTPQACDRFDRFVEILQPQSMTYVFSSYYLNNPASAFGHTFLRINKSPSSRDGERYELFDYGVGYAAVQISNNPFVYSFLGLTGMMPGSFDINPYYYKVREYNDFESRDLWEYDLNFTPDEVTMMVAYIWELLNANFNYSYFKENCAYRILAIFETVRPTLNLTSQLKSQVMPADTVQTLFETEGLVKDIHYRPSGRVNFQTRFDNLSKPEQKNIMTFAKDESIESLKKDLDKDQQMAVLDTAMDFLDFKYPKEILAKKDHFNLKKEILLARAEIGGISPTLKIAPPWNEAPHDAQGSRRMGLGLRNWDDDSKSYLFNFKFSLHDLLDPKLGYPPTAEITMGDLSFAYDDKDKKLTLDKFTFYEVISLAPIDAFNNGVSWRLKATNDRGYESNCQSLCNWSELSGGSGTTFSFWKDLEIALWIRASLLTSSDFVEDHWIIGGGPGLTIRWNRDWLAILAESYYRYDYRGQHHEFRQNSLGVNFSFNKNFSLRLEGRDENSLQRTEARLLYYY